MEIVNVSNLTKVYAEGTGGQTVALRQVSFGVQEGEFIAIMGESGSGKTTLLNMISTLDKPTEGQIMIGGKDVSQLKNDEIAAFRRRELGFVFQDFNLLDTFNNRDNIFLPLVLSGVRYQEMARRIKKISPSLDIEDLLDKYPYEVSGGQKQRVAIGRALITNPKLLLADEPTGALDSNSSDKIMDIFSDINKAGQTVLMVTHSLKAASYAGRVLFIKDGGVYHEVYKGEKTHRQFMETISDAQLMLRGGKNEE
ncbi:ABC transporter ATP-binding protein [Eubacteriales bacterium KG127]